jgi:hypothetical protein
VAKKITWWQAAEILGISDRHMRRWRERYEEFGFRGCLTGGAASLRPTGFCFHASFSGGTVEPNKHWVTLS